MSKSGFRKAAIAARNALTPGERATLSALAVQRLAELPEVIAADPLMAYLALARELSLDSLIALRLSAGKRVAVPATLLAERRLAPLLVTGLEEGLVRGPMGIREPQRVAESPVVRLGELRTVILPGVAFDERGGRLGYGGGFYDRFCSELAVGVVRIGVAFDEQIYAEVPREPHDIAVDILVTPTRTLRFASSL